MHDLTAFVVGFVTSVAICWNYQ